MSTSHGTGSVTSLLLLVVRWRMGRLQLLGADRHQLVPIRILISLSK